MNDFIDTVHIGAGSYPSPDDPDDREIKISGYFEATVTVYGDDEDKWREQVMQMTQRELLVDVEKIEVEDINI